MYLIRGTLNPTHVEMSINGIMTHNNPLVILMDDVSHPRETNINFYEA